MTDQPILRIQDLCTSYGAVHALKSVSMDVQRGSICAVLGANGAGKTTLLRTVSGLQPTDSGRVLVDGVDVTRAPAESMVGHGIAHVPEGGGVIVELTVEENLRLGGLARRGRARRARALARTLELFPPLAQRRGRAAATLSGGERQMLAIGRALMAEPRVLLLDEPSLGLAPLITRQILRLLRDLRSDTGLTVVLVEQNATSALSITDQGFVLSQGQVVASGTSDGLLTDDRMRHAYLGF